MSGARCIASPGFGSRILAFFLKLIPKVGPFRAVNFKIPTQQTEDMYIKSVNLTRSRITRRLLSQVDNREHLTCPTATAIPDAQRGPPNMPLSDRTYARLVDELSRNNGAIVPAPLRENILQFYYDLNAPIATQKDKKAWKKLLAELSALNQRAKARLLPLIERSPESAGNQRPAPVN